jgi:DNA topoisomerase-3
VARRFREPSKAESAAIERILDALGREDGQPVGRLYRDTFGEKELDRRSFEHLLGALSRAGLLEVRADAFEKGGEWIEFQRVCLTEEGKSRGGRPDRFVTLDESEGKKTRKKRSGKMSSKAFWAMKARQRRKN